MSRRLLRRSIEAEDVSTGSLRSSSTRCIRSGGMSQTTGASPSSPRPAGLPSPPSPTPSSTPPSPLIGVNPKPWPSLATATASLPHRRTSPFLVPRSTPISATTPPLPLALNLPKDAPPPLPNPTTLSPLSRPCAEVTLAPFRPPPRPTYPFPSSDLSSSSLIRSSTTSPSQLTSFSALRGPSSCRATCIRFTRLSRAYSSWRRSR